MVDIHDRRPAVLEPIGAPPAQVQHIGMPPPAAIL